MSRYESAFRPDLFAGQVVLVTGGGTGIGRCTAHELASLGATVVIAGRRPEPLEKTAAEIAEAGGKCDTVQLDIREEESVNEALAQIVAKHGRLDGLFNNAGGQFLAPASEMSVKGWKAVVNLNLNGTFIMCKAAYEHSMKERGGVIVNMLVDYENGMPSGVHTSAARAGIDNMTRTLALEWASYGIRLNSVEVGDVLGNGWIEGPYTLEQQKEGIELTKGYPIARYGTESEISAVAVFLLSPASSYVTGDKIAIAGGAQLQKPTMMPEPGERVVAPFQGFHLRPDFTGTPFEGID